MNILLETGYLPEAWLTDFQSSRYSFPGLVALGKSAPKLLQKWNTNETMVDCWKEAQHLNPRVKQWLKRFRYIFKKQTKCIQSVLHTLHRIPRQTTGFIPAHKCTENISSQLIGCVHRILVCNRPCLEKHRNYTGIIFWFHNNYCWLG